MLFLQTLLRVGRTLGKSHKIEGILNKGGFGVVTKCRNRNTNKLEAVKISPWRRDTVHQVRSEVKMLRRLRHLNPDTSNIVKWNGYFFDNSKICMNFELLDMTLHDYLNTRGGQGLPLPEVRSVLHQLTKALLYLQAAGIVHADLKPLNVMVVDRHENPIRVRLIDFGLAQPASETTSDVLVQSTGYKAPEVIVAAPFNEAIDMWTLGLVAVETSVGKQFFPGKEIYDVLRFIVELQGQPPDHVLDRAKKTSFYFQRLNKDSEPRWKFRTPKEVYESVGYYSEDTRHFHIRTLDDLEYLIAEQTGPHPDLPLLVDLIKKMLHLDPEKRIKPMEVLKHPLFAESHPMPSDADVSLNATIFSNLCTGKTPSVSQTTKPETTPDSVQSPSKDVSTEDTQNITQHYSTTLLGDEKGGVDFDSTATADIVPNTGWFSGITQTVKQKVSGALSYIF